MLIKKKLSIVAATLLLTACGIQPNHSIYNWGENEYADSVYTYLNQEGDPQEQVMKLETLVTKSNGKKVAPGLYAQIGLLYNQLGQPGKALAALNKEAETYPESKQYIQFLINKGNKTSPATEMPAEKKSKKGAKK